jgi:hypothetical protein
MDVILGVVILIAVTIVRTACLEIDKSQIRGGFPNGDKK